jgi:transposase-like protein
VARERGYRGSKRKQYAAAFKAQAARAALKGDKTVHELAARCGADLAPIYDWKRQLLAGAEQDFGNGVKADTVAHAKAQKAELSEQIGRLK